MKRMHYSLRTLLILLALGPPLLATAWTNREYLAENRPDMGFYVPAENATVEGFWRKRLAPVQALHSLSGAGMVVLYPVAVMLQWAVFRRWRDWRQPPKQSPLFWAAFAAALLVGIFFLVFFLTLPSLWNLPNSAGRSWKPL
jgi:amino acid transporter